LLAACGAGSDASQNQTVVRKSALGAVSKSAAANIQILPLEVLGTGSPSKPVIAEAQLGIDAGKLGSVTQLWFQCHRCGFYSAPEFEKTSALPVKVKASAPVPGGAATSSNTRWIDIPDANVTLADDERPHGGVNRGFYTTRIYRSNQWYQLQMTIDPGGQSGWVNYPMDWPCLTAFDKYIANKVGANTPGRARCRTATSCACCRHASSRTIRQQRPAVA
jgi:hypothetical protein